MEAFSEETSVISTFFPPQRFFIPIPQSQSVKVQYFRPAVDHQQLGQTEKYFEIQTFALARLRKPAPSSQQCSVAPWDGNSVVAGWNAEN
jgi:hypothetical protein